MYSSSSHLRKSPFLSSVEEKITIPVLDKKKKKHKKSKHKNKSLDGVSNSLIQKYSNLNAKANTNNAVIKTLIDTVSAGVIGTAISATAGKYAPIVGAVLSFTGHYMDDKTGLLRGIGMSTIAHSVAKVSEYRKEESTLQERLGGLKDDLLKLAFMKNENDSSFPKMISPKTAVKNEVEANLKSSFESSNEEQNKPV